MAKVFEDYFSQALTDMIDICAEYADYRAEKVFVYSICTKGNGAITQDFFYQFHGKIVDRSRLNDALENGEEPIDTDPSVQGQVLDILFRDLLDISKACKAFQREIPVELFLTYDMRTKKFDAKCSYKPVDDFMEADRWMAREAAALGTTPITSAPQKR